jgi:putative peptide maturation dehydrogenase
MMLRRCAVVMLEPRESLEFDLESVLQGGNGVRSMLRWHALAPHLGDEVEIDAAEREAIGALGETHWQERAHVDAAHGADVVDRLLAKGLLIGDDDTHRPLRERDAKVRDAHWRPLSAVAHVFSRWETVDSGKAAEEAGLHNTGDLARRYGTPPHHFHSRTDAVGRVSLERPAPSTFDDHLARRTTCRNYDRTRALPFALFSRMLHTVLAAQAIEELAPGSAAVKKTSPAGGGLHATEGYVLVHHVDGVPPGLYHYHSGDHALEALPLADASLDDLALRFVAGQHWFSGAHVLLILAPRFKRCFWKYRNHAKAYRALVLDAGHLSQTLYLAATDLGLGAFITSAINEIEIERAFGLDPLDEGPLAVCGFGWRADEKVTIEFDPLKRVWP